MPRLVLSASPSTRRRGRLALAWFAAAWITLLAMDCSTTVAADGAAARPNIVFIMADDLGWTDLACQGSRYYETPHIDKLAQTGLTFDCQYMCQNCAPTRAALMSGQYAPRTGIYSVGSLVRGKPADRRMQPPENQTQLPLDKITLAQSLKQAGYATGMFGKWHLGFRDFHPARRGFDEAIVSNGKHFDFDTQPKVDVPPGAYLADFLTDRAVDFIQRHRDEPFFLYLPHFGVHSPLQAKREWIDHFEDKAAVGGHNHAVYAGMIASVDESVGRIMAKLDELKLSEKTLIVFTSDNGGVGGYPVPGTQQTKGTTDNAPLRGGKGMLYEGGIRVPLIMRWAGVTPTGGRCSFPVVHVDWYPTLLDLAGAKPPADYPLDGVSIARLMKDPQADMPARNIYWHFPGYLESYIKEDVWRTTPVSVVRSGDFKLLQYLEDGRLELYDLKNDISESRNLAESMPDKAAQLKADLESWRTQTSAAMPTPRPGKGGGAKKSREQPPRR
mgnify:CR=1 FL=1